MFHGGLHPWRVVEFPERQREALADRFEEEKRHALPAQVWSSRIPDATTKTDPRLQPANGASLR
ncbi:hypothetical protein E5CHR_04510 [Variovorax sp. PBL-E5]|nr:hypothetical protein E5CHR_04510 [Variovorax sp. PBL-E5]